MPGSGADEEPVAASYVGGGSFGACAADMLSGGNEDCFE
jgi:hypothetical protein